MITPVRQNVQRTQRKVCLHRVIGEFLLQKSSGFRVSLFLYKLPGFQPDIVALALAEPGIAAPKGVLVQSHGFAGSAAVDHSAHAAVTQRECLVKVLGALPIPKTVAGRIHVLCLLLYE